MDTFAFIIHPLDVNDVARKFSFTNYMPASFVERLLRFMPPFQVSRISGIESDYNSIEGWFVSCPLTARQMVHLPQNYVLKRIVQAGNTAHKLGAKIIGLGAFTSVIGDGGISIAKELEIPVTTGNSYTVGTAIQGTREASKLMGHDINNARVVVLGATGSIGKVCARLLAKDVKNLTLVARNKSKLEMLSQKILYESGLAVKITSDVKSAIKSAQVVVAVTSNVDSLIGPRDLNPGTVICDVSRPRSVSKQVAKERNDVLVIEGGIVKVPGEVNFNFDFGFPPGMAYACMAETMILALEKKYENFTLGKELSLEQVREISRLANKHGFKLTGFRSFEKAVSMKEIESIKRNAQINNIAYA
ncbi:MAG: NAD(P)H-binding protein [Clostridiales bacterium]|nr:NAD(P)H-binding protein [Clostridiales bacterium]MCF8023540.1 NAD(P)H-binding protein [Clostridiales bacterium]